MEVILDTNFIISCAKKKIDFVEQLEYIGFKILVPKEVVDELKDLRRKVSHNERIAIDVGLQMINSKKVKSMKLPGEIVDDGLISMGRQGAYIATLDAYVKRSVPNSVIIDSRKNGILVEKK